MPSTLKKERSDSVLGLLNCVGGFPGGSVVKNPPANAGGARDSGSIPGSGRSTGGRAWQPTPVFLPGKFPGQRSPAGYNLWGRRESDATERLSTRTNTQKSGDERGLPFGPNTQAFGISPVEAEISPQTLSSRILL